MMPLSSQFATVLRRLTLIMTIVMLLPAYGTAQEAAKPFKKEELQQLLAPVALYPDQLLAQVLMASTYPLQIVQAARWQKENAKLSGDNLDKALSQKEWDPSVKSLVPLPQVLQMMNDKLEWTQKLGDAFLAQQSDVMAEVQYLRAKAQEAGSLKSTKQQTVSKNENIIVVQPASPQVIYVPIYDPVVVYGVWWYPAYPPYYYRPPGAVFAAGFFWGSAIAVSGHYWGWGHCNWHRGDIDIDVNRYNEINVNRTQITSNRWQHDPVNRGQVPYRDAKSREKFTRQAGPASPATREARGFDKPGAEAGGRVSGVDKRDAKARDHGSKDFVKPDTPGTTKNAAPDRKTSAGGTPGRVADRSDLRPAKHDTPSAFELQRGSEVRSQAMRGHASRQSLGAHGGGRPGGGGGRVDGGGRRR